MLSGAVLDPSTLRDLIPDFKEKGAPLAADVHDEDVYFLTQSSKLAFPIIPPPLKNHGNYIISLNQFVRWLTGQVEAAGIDFFTGFAGQDILMDGARVARRPHRRSRHRQARRAEADVRAWRRHPCEGHDLLRRRARQPHERADAPAAARRRRGSRSSSRSVSRSCGKSRTIG